MTELWHQVLEPKKKYMRGGFGFGGGGSVVVVCCLFCFILFLSRET